MRQPDLPETHIFQWLRIVGLHPRELFKQTLRMLNFDLECVPQTNLLIVTNFHLPRTRRLELIT
jgi:hypothetical protein